MSRVAYHLARVVLVAVLGYALAAPFGLAQGQGDPLPRLEPGTHLGLVYADAAPEAKETLDAVYRRTVEAGVNSIALSFFWSALEPTPGQHDTALLEQYLAILDILNMKPYFVFQTIDTVKLALPADLLDSSGNLAQGRHFDDPAIIARFNALLDTIVPLLADHRGFFISVGNEIDVWLRSHPGEVQPFLNFIEAARAHVQELAPGMGVGATITYSGVRDRLPLVSQVLAASDAAAFTYYPLNDDFSVRDPAVVADDFAAMVAVAGGKPVLLQEVGYPSGYLPESSNGSSVDKQKSFVENVFRALGEQPDIRFMSYFMLADWSTAECDMYTEYYGLAWPRFHEYLCSLGLYTTAGDPKPGFESFLAGVRRISQSRAG